MSNIYTSVAQLIGKTPLLELTNIAKNDHLKARVLAKLEGCKRMACEVHHIQPLKTPEGWERRLDWDNLQGVCVACHNILDGKQGKRRQTPGVVDLREIERKL